MDRKVNIQRLASEWQDLNEECIEYASYNWQTPFNMKDNSILGIGEVTIVLRGHTKTTSIDIKSFVKWKGHKASRLKEEIMLLRKQLEEKEAELSKCSSHDLNCYLKNRALGKLTDEDKEVLGL